MPYVYLILSKSSSAPAKAIRLVSQNEINHSSVALEPSLTEMYSFGRIWTYFPFYAGFVVENKDKGFYKRFDDTYIRVYKLSVSEATFRTAKEYLKNFKENPKNYKYNALGLVLNAFGKSCSRENQFYCSEFVATVFKDCGIRDIDRDVHTYRPNFFEDLPDKELIYDGMMRDYSNDTKLYDAS